MRDGIIKDDGTSRLIRANWPATYEEFRAMAEAAELPLDLLLNEGGWEQLPTILSKLNLLQDSTEIALFGSANDRTVDEAFAGVARKLTLIMSDMASMTVTVKSANGNPIGGVMIDGLFDASGNTVITDSSGKASGYLNNGSNTLSVLNYADIEDWTETVTAVKGETLTKTITLTTRNFLKILSTKNVKFSANVSKVDVTVVGGGGGGAMGGFNNSTNYTIGGAGGGGGYCKVQESIVFTPNTAYLAIVGNGGAGGSKATVNEGKGNTGGTSSFMGVSASGGSGGTKTAGAAVAGNGNGGAAVTSSRYSPQNGVSGQNGSVAGYSSFTETVIYGGGGGSGSSNGDAGGAGGKNYGAAGGRAGNSGSNAQTGTGGGGGGGGASVYDVEINGEYSSTESSFGAGGNGGSGCVSIRMHLTAA